MVSDPEFQIQVVLIDVSFTELHQPPPNLAKKLGYPPPLVDHHDARERAIKRYKNPGEA